MADTELKYLDKDGLSHFLQAIRGDSTPLVDGTAAVGTAKKFSRQDHVHPTDTTRAPLASPALTGTPTAPTAATGTSTTQIATTEFVANTVGAMTSGVSDVKVDNTSVVTSGVANINTFTGATASANGTKGLVPAPSSGSNKLWWVLSANGAWKGILNVCYLFAFGLEKAIKKGIVEYAEAPIFTIESDQKLWDYDGEFRDCEFPTYCGYSGRSIMLLVNRE